MKEKILFSLLFVFNLCSSQVGINTTSPQSTFQVDGKPTDANAVDGVLVPRLTLEQLNAKNNSYGQDQEGVIVYVTDNILSVSPIPDKVKYVTAAGYYVFNGVYWGSLEPQAGDVVFKGIRTTSFRNDNSVWFSVPLTEVTNVGGGVWDSSSNLYTIPITGTYFASARIRTNGAAPADVHINVGLDTEMDSPTGVWGGVPAGESTMSYFRSLYFKKGDRVRLIMYTDYGLDCASATLNMYLLSSYGGN